MEAQGKEAQGKEAQVYVRAEDGLSRGPVKTDAGGRWKWVLNGSECHRMAPLGVSKERCPRTSGQGGAGWGEAGTDV